MKPTKTDQEIIAYLLGELDKISKIEPEKSPDLERSVGNLITSMFKAKHTALMAIIEAEKQLNS